jgi:MraZ protein
MFFGQYRHSLDSKKRLTIPSRFREELKDGAYVVEGLDGNLMVFTAFVFEKIYLKIGALTLTDEGVRDLRRKFFSHAGYLDIDNAGRILIPEYLRETAGIQNEAVVTGAGSYFEIWSPEAWEQRLIRLQDPEANKERFATLDIPTL